MKDNPISLSERVRPILGALRTIPIPAKAGQPEVTPPPPFITIARQAGAGALTFAQQLVELLNAADAGDRPWTCWDRELVEKVAADHHLSEDLIESLETSSHNWMTEFLNSLTFADNPQQADEAKVYGRVAATIRAMAQVGRVVIVGRGGVFLTRAMAGGIHLFLTAPEAYRVGFMAKKLGVSENEAAAVVKQMEKNRAGFYKRFWPGKLLTPETFTMCLNTAELSSEVMGDVVKRVVVKVASSK